MTGVGAKEVNTGTGNKKVLYPELVCINANNGNENHVPVETYKKKYLLCLNLINL